MTTVTELISDLGDRIEVTAANSLPYVNKAVWLIAKRLFKHNSDMITSDLSVTVAADDNEGDLPSDFAGLIGEPNINGKTWTLKPLPHKRIYTYYRDNYSEPDYYEIRGTKIRLTPGTSSEITIEGDYFAKPTTLTAVDDSIPWNGLLDDIVAEYTVEASKLRPIPEASLQTLVVAGVDAYIKMHDRKAPSRPYKVDWRYRFR